MKNTVLLLGLSDGAAVQRELQSADASLRFLSCQSLEDGKRLLKRGALKFVIVDDRFGEAAVNALMQWLVGQNPTRLAIIGDRVNDALCINALNSHLGFAYLTRPVTSEQAVQALKNYNAYKMVSGEDFLKRVKGATLNFI